MILLRDCEDDTSIYNCYKDVIARYEAIPDRQSGYANPPCKVGDCFVPRNDDSVK